MSNIPQVPEGIFNPENLYNDVYGGFPPLRWSDPEFHDKLAWIREQVPYTITSWYSILNSGAPDGSTLRTSTMFRAEVGTGEGADFDVLNVVRNPDLLVYAFKRLLNPVAVLEQIKPYPGFTARNPVTLSPIGPEWTPSPWVGRKLYRDNAGDKYAVGTIWEDVDARYQRVRVQTKSGSGMFGTGGVFEPAWEVVYRR